MVLQKTREFASTTLVIMKPTDYAKLNQTFNLVRYKVPEEVRYNKGYDKLYIRLRAQLDVPYRHYFYDDQYGVVVYALFPKNVKAKPIVLDFLSNDPLECDEQVDFGTIHFFNLVKLLQADYFNLFPYFAGIGNYYVHGKQTGENWHVCLEIKLRGANENITDAQELDGQEFLVTGHATNFCKLDDKPDDDQKGKTPYYTRTIQDGLVVFHQVRYTELDKTEGDLFFEYSKQNNRAQLAYHDHLELPHGRAFILYQFTSKFISHLGQYGIQAKRKTRQWRNFSSKLKFKELPIKKLETVYLYDNRINKVDVSIASVQNLLIERYGQDVKFVLIDDLETLTTESVLIIHDVHRNDFRDNGIFVGSEYVDPYPAIYRKHTTIPKQSLNINPNSDISNRDKLFKSRTAEYLKYSVPKLQEERGGRDIKKDTSFGMRVQVCLYQLYLKTVVMNRLSVSQYLPLQHTLSTLSDYIYISRRTFEGVKYSVALQIRKDELFFIDFRTNNGKQQLEDAVRRLDLDWGEIYDVLLKKYHKYDKPENKRDVAAFDLILMPKLAIELEEVDECVLYDYGEINERRSKRQLLRSIDELRLMPHYDVIRSKPRTLSWAALVSSGLLQKSDPTNVVEEASLKFFKQLEKYEVFLDKLSATTTRVSIQQLLQDPYREQIGVIFDLPSMDRKSKAKKVDKKQYNTKRITDYFKIVLSLKGDKATDVQLSRGIWYTEDNYYRVGDVDGFNSVQERDFRIRHFDILIGEKAQFNILPFLEATAVKFVRYKQYTVEPYVFYLIDKYIQDVLHRGKK